LPIPIPIPLPPSKPRPRPAAPDFFPGPSPIRQPRGDLPRQLADVYARLERPEYWRDESAPNDLITWVHEGTHGVSARIPRRPGYHAIYLLDGRAVYLKHPRLTIADVAAAIPPAERGEVFQLYLVEQRRYWNAEPCYLLEEWTAYIHGAAIRAELGQKTRGETVRFALEMERYARTLLNLAKRDSGYNETEKLAAFIEWNAARLRRIADDST
jgi:hypothetical protein